MNNQEQIWKIGKVVGILLAVFLAVLSVKELKSIGYVGKEFPATNAITVSGKGEAVSIPNIATFSFTVNETAKTVKEAQDKATEKINNALKAVKAGGVAEKDIKTLSYSINPHYEYNQPACTSFGCPGGKQVLTGYDVAQTIEVKVRDLTKAGSLFDTIGTAGIQTVNGLTFSIDEIDSVKAIARADAIEKAKAKAKIISKDLGVRLVRITNYYDSSDEQTYPYARESAMGGDVMTLKASIAPQIPTGEQKITSTVSITYEIR
jgi:uncharacterized protein YggE